MAVVSAAQAAPGHDYCFLRLCCRGIMFRGLRRQLLSKNQKGLQHSLLG